MPGNFSCSLCAASFVRQNGLTYHQRHFHDELNQRGASYVDEHDEIEDNAFVSEGSTQHFEGAGERGDAYPRSHEAIDWDPLYPFNSETQWNFCRMVFQDGMSKNAVDTWIKMGLFSPAIGVDTVDQLWELLLHCQTGMTGDWIQDEIELLGTKRTFWRRDPMAAVQYLMGNPAFQASLCYCPQKEYDPNNERVYHEMWSGDWWWRTQVNIISF